MPQPKIPATRPPPTAGSGATPPAASPSKPDLLLLAIIQGHNPENACRVIGIPPADQAKMIADARRRLTLAADYERDEQLGVAIARLNAIYAATQKDDPRTALAAQKDLNRLMDLYGTPPAGDDGDGGAAAAELAAVVGHLEPLKLAPDGTPPSELARLAVGELVSRRSER